MMNESKIAAALEAEAEQIQLPVDLLQRIRQEAAQPQPGLRRARQGRTSRRRWSFVPAVALVASVFAVTLFATSVFSFGPNVVMAMGAAIDNVTSYHGMMADGTEIWRDGNKFAVKYPNDVAIISDGTTWWQAVPAFSIVHKSEALNADLIIKPNLRQLVSLSLKHPNTIEGQETVAGRPTTRVLITPPADEHKPYRIWIDKETNLPLQWEEYTWDEKEPVKLQTFVKFERNLQIDPSVFQYQPPADWQVTEQPHIPVASIDDAATLAGFRPLLPQDKPVQILASKYEILLDFGDVTIAQAKARDTLEVMGTKAWGTAAGGPMEVSQSGLEWRQNGVQIVVMGSSQSGDHYLKLARQIAPDLTMPNPKEDLVGAARIKVPVDMEAARQLEARSKGDGRDGAHTDAPSAAYWYLSQKGEAPQNLGLNVLKNTGAQAVLEMTGGKYRRVYLQKLIRPDERGVWFVVGFDPVE